MKKEWIKDILSRLTQLCFVSGGFSLSQGPWHLWEQRQKLKDAALKLFVLFMFEVSILMSYYTTVLYLVWKGFTIRQRLVYVNLLCRNPKNKPYSIACSFSNFGYYGFDTEPSI